MSLLLMALLWMAPQQPKKVQHRHTTRKSSHPAVHKPEKREGISSQRAAEIQKALVAAGYLNRASGHWDSASAAAMKKYQADHHWQTRFVPDARALFALGLVQPSVRTQVAAAGNGGGGNR